MEDLNKYSSRDLVPVECSYCGITTELQKNRLLDKLKGNTHGNIYCSRKCASQARTISRTEITCNCCGKKFYRKATEANNVNYCSQSCAATINGKLHPKRSPKNEDGKRVKRVLLCLMCCTSEVRTTGAFCKSCKKSKSESIRSSKTLGQLKKESRELHFASIKVRNHARKFVKPLMGTQECVVCGYKTYVEVCHKKAVSEFDDSDTLGEINSLENLVFLCPNHHKEFDLGLLVL